MLDFMKDFSPMVVALGGTMWGLVLAFFTMRESQSRAHHRIDALKEESERRIDDLAGEFRRLEDRLEARDKRIEGKLDRLIDSMLNSGRL